MAKKLAAELAGTAILVYFAVGVATLSFGFGVTGGSFSAGVIATALAFGLTLMAIAYSLGPVSGGHVNPAVTLGFWLAGRMSLTDAAEYWAAQFVGGIVGALALWGTFNTVPGYSKTSTGLGTDGFGAASALHVRAGGAFIAETILTFLFVFVILAVTHKSAQVSAAVCGLIIGLTLTVVHLIGIPITGTSVNPARAIGPALVVGGTAIRQVWLFILAPLVGGALAATAHVALYGQTQRELDAEEATASSQDALDEDAGGEATGAGAAEQPIA
jgi:aquaporin Z